MFFIIQGVIFAVVIGAIIYLAIQRSGKDRDFEDRDN